MYTHPGVKDKPDAHTAAVSGPGAPWVLHWYTRGDNPDKSALPKGKSPKKEIYTIN